MRNKYNIGLALSGGSVKGFAHLGVLQYLDEVNIKPDVIAGTSAGSLMAALYADGYKPEEILHLFDDRGFTSMTSLKPMGGGVFDTSKFTKFLKAHLRHKRIEDLPIPLRIVATDLDKGCQHIFTEGPLAECITASCSIPVLFNPILIDGTTYVDGGLFRNFPVSVLKEDCRVTIGVHLNPSQSETYEKSITSVAQRSWQLIFRQNAHIDRTLCDILIEPEEVVQYSMFDLTSARDIMNIGYRLAQESFQSAEAYELLRFCR